MNVSVVILSYFKLHRLRPCVESVIRNLDNKDELIIVDNSVKGKSPDAEIRRYLKELAATETRVQIQLVLNDKNTRFSRGMNQGIQLATKPYVFLVNNDIELLRDDTIHVIIAEMESDESVASITPVTIYSSGAVYCSGAYGGGAHRVDKIAKKREAEWNNFAFVCLRKAVIDKIGVLATTVTNVNGRRLDCSHYHSDEEWCRRATANGYKHIVVPILVRHFHREG